MCPRRVTPAGAHVRPACGRVNREWTVNPVLRTGERYDQPMTENWKTSTYSDIQGDQCIEADGPWRASTHSVQGNCVEAAGPWVTSTYSNQGNCVQVSRPWKKSTHSGTTEPICVEVALGTVVRVRDTKDRTRGIVGLGAQAWDAFLVELVRR